MHAVDSSDHHHPRYRYRYAIDCGRAQILLYARSLATVLRIKGEIDACNAARVGTEIRCFTKMKTPLILDLSHLDFLGIDGFQELLALNHENRTAGLYCSVVAGTAMRPLLRIVNDAGVHGLPLVKSVPEAVQLIEDAVAGRRQVLQHLVR
jgi:anti-anti-sigma regulatory factor